MQKEPMLLGKQCKTQRDNTQKDPDCISKKQSHISAERKSTEDYKGTISAISLIIVRIDKRGAHYVSKSFYCDIRPETVESVKDIIGASDPPKYIELFGEVEEA